MVLLTARAARVANKKHIRSLEFEFLTIPSDCDEPPLLWALRHKKYDLVKYLVEERGIDLTMPYNNGIAIAAYYGLLDLVILFHTNGADIHLHDELALQWAAQNGQYDVVCYLVSHGADIHANNELALCFVVYNGHYDIFRYLHENGADIHIDNEYPLRCAARNDHINIVHYLHENGADIDVAISNASDQKTIDILKTYKQK